MFVGVCGRDVSIGYVQGLLQKGAVVDLNEFGDIVCVIVKNAEGVSKDNIQVFFIPGFEQHR